MSISELSKLLKKEGIMTVSQQMRFYRGKYDGKPCRVCGETLRYRRNKRCVECKGRIDHENYLARKEAGR